MSQTESALFNIADHPTPKIDEGGVAFSLRAENHNQYVAKVYDWHRCDTRMTELGEICNTMSASWGGGGTICRMLIATQ